MHVTSANTHNVWDRGIPPIARVDPGETVTVELLDTSGGQITSESEAQAVGSLDLSKVNPLTGPLWVEGASPGDALVVEFLDIAVGSWGYCANIPPFGLLADRFTKPHLRIIEIGSSSAELVPGLAVPVMPMVGMVGVAPADRGPHPTIPPTRHGGNMDIRHVTVGSRVWLPVAVPGALLSLGDTHAAQGDGEICGTGIETSSTVVVRVSVEHDVRLGTPLIETDPRSARPGRSIATTGIGPGLYEAARDAANALIDEIVRRTGIAAVDAYLLASIAADMKISEIVDTPNFLVSLHIEKEILGE